jgi:hypothetical protein
MSPLVTSQDKWPRLRLIVHHAASIFREDSLFEYYANMFLRNVSKFVRNCVPAYNSSIALDLYSGVRGSHLDWATATLSVRPAKCRHSTSIVPLPRPSKSFLIHQCRCLPTRYAKNTVKLIGRGVNGRESSGDVSLANR